MNKNEFDTWVKENDSDENMKNAIDWYVKARFGDNLDYDKVKEVISFEEFKDEIADVDDN